MDERYDRRLQRGLLGEVMGTRTMDGSGTHSERGENIPDAAQHFARIGSTGRPIWRPCRTANFRRISRSIRITCRSQRVKVHFIRPVRDDRTISVLNEDFDVDESLAYEYVWATIDTKDGQLVV